MRVEGKVVVVTGAGSGLGREIARELLRRGGRVAAVDLRAESLAETARLAAAGDRLSTHVCDITDRSAVEALPDAVLRAHGSVDAIVNNAGIIQPFTKVQDLDYPTMERIMAVNFWGTVHVVKAFLPLLLARPEAYVADVSSMGGFLPVPGQAVYGASKAAVKLLTEALYAELRDTAVGVSVVLPGGMSTNIAGNSGVATPAMDAAAMERAVARTTSPTDAARLVVDGIERGRLHIHIGRDSRMMDAAVRIAPKRATHLIQQRMRGLLAHGS